MSGLVGSNSLIRSLAESGKFLLKTHTRRGVVYHVDGTLKPVSEAVALRLIDKGVLIAREESEQSFELSIEWGGTR